MEAKKCLECGEEFNDGQNNKKFCSNKCYQRWYHKQNKDKYVKPKVIKKRVCLYCNKEFSNTNNFQRYCSSRCRSDASNEKQRIENKAKLTEIKCECCGNEFLPTKASNKYCSVNCGKKMHARLNPKPKKKQSSRTCKECGKEFIPKHERAEFCCTPCYRKWYQVNNKELFNNYSKKYRDADPEKYRRLKRESYERTTGAENKIYRETAKECPVCKKSFFPNQRNTNFCSISCYWVKYYEENKDKISLKAKEWDIANRDWVLKRKRKYNRKHSLRNRISIGICENKRKEHYVAKKNAWTTNKRKTDPQYYLAEKYRALTRYPLVYGRMSKACEELLGCNYDEFINHLESKFQFNMLWENRGEWEIDHIIAIKNFDLTNYEEVKKCFHYTNTQPLWKYQNAMKESLSRQKNGGDD